MIRTEDIYMHAPQVHEDILDFSSETSQIHDSEESTHTEYSTTSTTSITSITSTSILDRLLDESSEHSDQNKESSSYQSVYEFIDQEDFVRRSPQEVRYVHEHRDNNRDNNREPQRERRSPQEVRYVHEHREVERERRSPQEVRYVHEYRDNNRERRSPQEVRYVHEHREVERERRSPQEVRYVHEHREVERERRSPQEVRYVHEHREVERERRSPQEVRYVHEYREAERDQQREDRIPTEVRYVHEYLNEEGFASNREIIKEKHYIGVHDDERVRKIVHDEIISIPQHQNRHSPEEREERSEQIVICAPNNDLCGIQEVLAESFANQISQTKNEIISSFQSQLDSVRNNVASQDSFQHLEKLHTESQENLEFKIKHVIVQCNEYANEKISELEALVANLTQKNTSQADQIAQLYELINNNHTVVLDKVNEYCVPHQQVDHGNEIHELRKKIDSLERSALTLTKMMERIIPNLKNRTNQ